MEPDPGSISVIIPANNEEAAIGRVVEGVRKHVPDAEIIVVDDGSIDRTAEIAEEAGATVIRHPQALGNGAAIKRGARNASGETLVLLDGDGQHDPADIPRLLERMEAGYDMVVGARACQKSHANSARLAANGAYNIVASIVTGHTIPDLTSGFRAARAQLFNKFLYLLPNGFSYPTTITPWHSYHGIHAIRLLCGLRGDRGAKVERQKPYPPACIQQVEDAGHDIEQHARKLVTVHALPELPRRAEQLSASRHSMLVLMFPFVRPRDRLTQPLHQAATRALLTIADCDRHHKNFAPSI